MSGAVTVTTRNLPNRTASYTLSGIDLSAFGFTYYAARSDCNGGALLGPLSNIILSVDGSTEANDWASRVVVNGGAMPSQATINACETFIESLMVSGIWSKMVALNMYAPDNLIAAITPLVKVKGNDPWTNQSFVAGDLSVNGLKGDGLVGGKLLKTGVFGDDLSNTSAAVTIYIHQIATVSAGGPYYIGYTNDAATIALLLTPDLAGNSASWIFNNSTGAVSTPTHNAGYYSGNRIAAADHRLFFASSGSPHAQIGATAVGASGAVSHAEIYSHAVRWIGHPSDLGINNARYSFAAIHQGLTQTESSAFFNAIQALRTAFGGGFV